MVFRSLTIKSELGGNALQAELNECIVKGYCGDQSFVKILTTMNNKSGSLNTKLALGMGTITEHMQFGWSNLTFITLMAE